MKKGVQASVEKVDGGYIVTYKVGDEVLIAARTNKQEAFEVLAEKLGDFVITVK